MHHASPSPREIIPYYCCSSSSLSSVDVAVTTVVVAVIVAVVAGAGAPVVAAVDAAAAAAAGALDVAVAVCLFLLLLALPPPLCYPSIAAATTVTPAYHTVQIKPLRIVFFRFPAVSSFFCSFCSYLYMSDSMPHGKRDSARNTIAMI